MQLKDFHYELPKAFIARYPLLKRSASRLLCLDSRNGEIAHRQFIDLLELVEQGDLLVFNDTKVIPARLIGQKVTGGRVEVLVERILDNNRILAQVRVSKPPRVGDDLLFGSVCLRVLGRVDPFYVLQYSGDDRSVLDVIEMMGQIPLPPYLHRAPVENDKARYQTVYAKYKGSVAAPTAGLHFDEELLQKLQDKKVETAYLTLHIGAGTFAPVRVENIKEHKMHAEYFEVSENLCAKIEDTKARGKRVIAVGTTSMRALETASNHDTIQPYRGETDIFIYPGYAFRCVDALITNLHLPCSTLLMLVCAFGGHTGVMHAYREAVAQSYRFFSYGDAMLIVNSLTRNRKRL